MRVLCIKDTNTAYTKKGPRTPTEDQKVYCGSYYTVVNEVLTFDGAMKYILSEKPKNCRYRKEYFVIPSEIDETELVNEKQLQSCVG